jgi:hypothetical protein
MGRQARPRLQLTSFYVVGKGFNNRLRARALMV